MHMYQLTFFREKLFWTFFLQVEGRVKQIHFWTKSLYPANWYYILTN